MILATFSRLFNWLNADGPPGSWSRARHVLRYWRFRFHVARIRGAIPSPPPEASSDAPLFSILLVAYRTPESWLLKAVDSVRRQSFDQWELCLGLCEVPPAVQERLEKLVGADSRIRIHELGANRGIAANNNALAARARGTFLAVLDHDDYLEHHALRELAPLARSGQYDMVYTDEDIVLRWGIPLPPLLKPDWSPESLLSYNYICHFCAFRRSLFEEIGGFRAGYEGAQDYDLFLRLSEKTSRIAHIPKVLYHWRRHALSTAGGAGAKPAAWEAGRQAVADHLLRTGQNAIVELGPYAGTFQVRHLRRRDPTVGIIIVPSGSDGALQRCLSSLERVTRYPNYRIRIAYPREAGQSPVSIRNSAAREASEDILLFLDDGVEAIQEDWIDRLVDQAARDAVAAAGPMLISSLGGIVHSGLALDAKKGLVDFHENLPHSAGGYGLRVRTIQNVSAVTGSCLCLRKNTFFKAGGLDESLPPGVSEAELCLRLIASGLRIVYTPLARALYHGTPADAKTRLHAIEAAVAAWEAGGHRERYFDTRLLRPETSLKVLASRYYPESRA